MWIGPPVVTQRLWRCVCVTDRSEDIEVAVWRSADQQLRQRRQLQSRPIVSDDAQLGQRGQRGAGRLSVLSTSCTNTSHRSTVGPPRYDQLRNVGVDRYGTGGQVAQYFDGGTLSRLSSHFEELSEVK